MDRDQLSELRETIPKIYLEDFFGPLKESINSQIEFQNQINSLFEKWKKEAAESPDDRNKKSEITKNYHNSLLEILSEGQFIISKFDLKTDFPKFYSALLNYLNSLEFEKIEDQNDNNFTCSKSSGTIRCILVKIKKIIFNRHKNLISAQNYFRKIFKKELKPAPVWKRSIPFRRLSNYYFGQKILIELLTILDEFGEITKESYLNFYSFLRKTDESFFNELTSQENENGEIQEYENETINFNNKLVEFSESLDSKFNAIFSANFQAFEKDYSLVGTVELPKSKYAFSFLEKTEEDFNNRYKSKRKRWANYSRAVYEIWKLYEELALITYTIINQFHSKSEALKSNVNKIVQPNFDKLIEILSDLLTKIKANENSAADIVDLIRSEKERVDKELSDNLILRIIHILPYENLGLTADNLNDEIKKIIAGLPEKRVIIKKNDFDKDVKDGDFHEINLNEIVEFDAYSKFLDDIENIRNENDTFIRKLSASILEIGQITSYNLETAISMFESDEENSNQKGYQIGVEGLERAIAKAEDNFESYSNFIDEKLVTVNESIVKLNINLRALNNLDQLFTLKIKISKAKTTEEVKRRFDKVVRSSKSFLPVVYHKSKKIALQLTGKVEEISSKVGLTSRVSDLSIEISEYLIETQNVINSLPFVYQRLFRNEPLNDERFFVGRDSELTAIKKAYDFWLKERFTAVVIIGEEGAGASTLINFADKLFDKSIKRYRTELDQSYYEEAKALKRITELFEIEEEVKDFQTLIDLINDSDEKKIVIIENLEEFFLKIVDGFYTLRKIFELISRTNKKIFWIMTCNLYAWKYLVKVVDIDDYFAFSVSLSELSNENMESIIMRRHSVSGYNLIFTPTEEEKKSKSFQKLKEDEQQEYLRKRFFERLNENSKSNIALAQLVWLSSIKSISNENIEILMPAKFDYSFLTSMQQQKFFSLAAIIIHDGLTINEHTAIFDTTFEESKLLLFSMEDDGILVNRNDTFKINFVLYRQVIALLQSKNILH